jgi:hypothetical protein
MRAEVRLLSVSTHNSSHGEDNHQGMQQVLVGESWMLLAFV